jgi:hypothetical protein
MIEFDTDDFRRYSEAEQYNVLKNLLLNRSVIASASYIHPVRVGFDV